MSYGTFLLTGVSQPGNFHSVSHQQSGYFQAHCARIPPKPTHYFQAGVPSQPTHYIQVPSGVPHQPMHSFRAPFQTLHTPYGGHYPQAPPQQPLNLEAPPQQPFNLEAPPGYQQPAGNLKLPMGYPQLGNFPSGQHRQSTVPHLKVRHLATTPV